MSERECDECGGKEPEVTFYKHAPTCHSCIKRRTERLPLGDKVEEHLREKERKKMLRAELKKLARVRMHTRKAAAKKRAQKRLIPEVPVEKIKVDPVAKEMASRILARRKLIEFIKQFHPRYLAGWVHHDICNRLEKFSREVDAGLSPRLMLLMPPRAGKSQIVSKLYPAWHLGHYPHHEFIGCSYNVSLALDFSREVRGVLRTGRYEALFDKTKLDPDFQSAESWKVVSPTGVAGGGYVAAGIGGGINGKGAHVLVIDDPLKNAEEAESVEIRNKIWDWYRSTAYTRLAPGGGVLLVQTLWHDDDLAGRLMTEMKEDPDADQFEVVKYPAIAEEDEAFRVKGEALHPERYPVEALLKIKRTLGNRYWSALYQQNPVPNEGAFFTKDMVVYRPSGLYTSDMDIYQAWDLAITDKQRNDSTVGITIGVDYDDFAHILEVRWFKTTSSLVIVNSMLDMWGKYKDVREIGVEDGQIWKTMKSLFDKRKEERRQYPHVTALTPIREKEVRARPLQGRMEAHKVTFPRGAEWMDNALRELLRFPAGVHDDFVDALAWCVKMLIGKQPPKRPRQPKNRLEKTTAEKIRAASRGGLGPQGRTHMSS